MPGRFERYTFAEIDEWGNIMNKESKTEIDNKENTKRKDKLIKKLKQFRKTKWFPLMVAGVILLVIVVVGFSFGFRITYAPELENSWDAISGIAAWVGILASIGGSFAAVFYAVRVADKQNQIALFEKRYEIYKLYVECETFSYMIDYTLEREEMYKRFMKVFCLEEVLEAADDKLSNIAPNIIHKKSFGIVKKMISAMFLFDEELSQYITTTAKKMSDVILMKYTKDNVEERREKISDFKNAIECSIDDDIYTKIERILKLK